VRFLHVEASYAAAGAIQCNMEKRTGFGGGVKQSLCVESLKIPAEREKRSSKKYVAGTKRRKVEVTFLELRYLSFVRQTIKDN